MAVVARKVDWRAFSEIVGGVDPRWAALGSLLTPLLIVGLALRWRIFLREHQLELPFSTTFSLTWAGQFFNSFLPGSTGGDVVKIFQLCRIMPHGKAAAAATVVADRLTALVALLALAGVAFLIEPLPLAILRSQQIELRFVSLIGLILVAIAVALICVVARSTHAARWRGRVQRTLAAVLRNFRLSIPTAIAVAVAFALHCLSFVIFYCFCRALHITIGYGQVLLMMPVILFLVMLPITINGHGLRELLLIAYFAHMGITISGQREMGAMEISVAVSLIAIANDLLWSVPGGLWYLLRFGGAPPPAQSAFSGSLTMRKL